MVNHILVPTDFSPLANAALNYAVDLAEKTGAKIQLSHIIESPSASYNSLGVMGQVESDEQFVEEKIFTKLLIDRVKQRLEKLSLDHSQGNVKVHPKVYFDSPYRSIMDRIKHDGIDLIVMGTKGASGMQEMLVGSNAEKVVRHSPVPVITLKSEISNHLPKRMVFASDFSEEMDKVMPFVKDLQELIGAELFLLRINTPNDFHPSRSLEKLMDDFGKKHSLENWSKHIYCDIVEEDGIIYFAEEQEADMIIMPTHARKGFSRLLAGSVSEDVVNHAKRPVLTLKIK